MMVRGARCDVRRSIAIVSSALVLTLFANGTSSAKGLTITIATLRAMQSWVDAVRTHTPGQSDEAVALVSRLSLDTRKEMEAGMLLFVAALTRNKVGIDMTSEPQRRMVDLARLARGNPDAQTFLERAVVLHSDAAIYADRYVAQVEQPDEPKTPPNRMKIDPASGVPIDLQDNSRIHPLLAHKSLILDKDGQILGSAAASWNWPFARWLVDYLLRETPFFGPCHGAHVRCREGSSPSHRHAERRQSDARAHRHADGRRSPLTSRARGPTPRARSHLLTECRCRRAGCC